VPVTCDANPPKIFAPVPGTGPYCDTGHCPGGQKCCLDFSTFTLTCAATCPAGVVSMACYNGAECPGGQRCCFNASADTMSCSYLTVRGNAGSVCATSCKATEIQACATSAECGGGVACTPAYFLNPAGTATTKAQAGFCSPVEP